MNKETEDRFINFQLVQKQVVAVSNLNCLIDEITSLMTLCGSLWEEEFPISFRLLELLRKIRYSEISFNISINQCNLCPSPSPLYINQFAPCSIIYVNPFIVPLYCPP